MEIRERIITILVSNKPGVLSRVAGVFGRLGYNIESLCVAETISPEISRITSITKADSDFIEKVKKQLTRLVDVLDVTELSPGQSAQREMILIGIKLDQKNRTEIVRSMGMFDCKIIFMRNDYCIIQVAGSREEVETVINLLRPFGIDKIARTGVLALRYNDCSS
ncbi:MAG: acetolactate synthase small subunit [Thermodesulfobacteriota bacterium]|nr:acetolactate synthase small subunit [Thermodesulfobacteriota bacterium]